MLCRIFEELSGSLSDVICEGKFFAGHKRNHFGIGFWKFSTTQWISLKPSFFSSCLFWTDLLRRRWKQDYMTGRIRFIIKDHAKLTNFFSACSSYLLSWDVKACQGSIRWLFQLHLVRDCWSENPDSRPTINTVRNIVKSVQRGGQVLFAISWECKCISSHVATVMTWRQIIELSYAPSILNDFSQFFGGNATTFPLLCMHYLWMHDSRISIGKLPNVIRQICSEKFPWSSHDRLFIFTTFCFARFYLLLVSHK